MLFVELDDLHLPAHSRVSDLPLVLVLIKTSFIDRPVILTHLMECSIFLIQFRVVAIISECTTPSNLLDL